ncbi:uncharacterized protein VTP21DRAFT_2982 [Calcarisporiella thermophila]|uniref:uncharacterized protein n=1 Tax=Calcarisporiella thermophila TaxID=911321 RepID=UPI00374456D2
MKGRVKEEPTEMSIGEFPSHIQEYSIIEDLLYVLLGISGTYIKVINFDDASESLDDIIEFEVDKTLDPSIADLIQRILPLATYYHTVKSYVERYSNFHYGLVNHAICSGMRDLLEGNQEFQGYMTLIAQLEHQFRSSPEFSLQKFWFYIHSTLHTMSVLSSLAKALALQAQPQSQEEDDLIAAMHNTKKDLIPLTGKGGSILNLLFDRMKEHSGDTVAKKIYGYLLNVAIQPYNTMVEAWIYRGEIDDPYNEFMIEERKHVRKENISEDYNDLYWENRYTLREHVVPLYLQPVQDKVLLAGKYLNVIRECGIRVSEKRVYSLNGKSSGGELREKNADPDQDSQLQLWTTADQLRVSDCVETAYKDANRTLLEFLWKDQQLLARLRSLKRYFFLDQSDFLTHFLDAAADELKKPAKDVSATKLESLMDLALRNPASVTADDPFKEDVRAEISSYTLFDQLQFVMTMEGKPEFFLGSMANVVGGSGGIPYSTLPFLKPEGGELAGEASAEDGRESRMSGISTIMGKGGVKDIQTGIDMLTLDYNVRFPLSLIISRKARAKYQLIFRFLLHLRHVEQLLSNTWLEHLKTPVWRRSSVPEVDMWKTRIFSMRTQMLTFVQQVAYYVTSDVLEPKWRELEDSLANISTVDDLIALHLDFLDTCLKGCIITTPKVVRAFQKMMLSCTIFTTLLERFTRSAATLDANAANMTPTELKQAIISHSKFLKRFEENFLHHMNILLSSLEYYASTATEQYLRLIMRLDFNRHYARRMADMPRVTTTS